MTSFTTLVNVDAEIATKVSLFISKLLKSELYYRECEDLIKQQNTSELIMKYLTSIDILFTIENDKGKILTKYSSISSIDMIETIELTLLLMYVFIYRG